jgi:hypothetical protein
MGCNCKNTITNFLGGAVPKPTTFLDCAEADGTYNNPLETGKTQCIAIENVLRVLDTYIINGEVKNSGEIVFERTVTGATYVGENIANADLNLDGNHTTDISTHTLTFDSGSADVLKLNGSSDAVVIGPSGGDYSMPKNRGTNKYVLQTDGAGGTSWVASDSDAVGYWSATTSGHIANSGFTNVGVGTHVPNYALTVSGTMGVNEYIYHNGDADTLIRFTDDRIRLEAGGLGMVGMHKKSSAPHQVTINNGGNNVDFVVKDDDDATVFKTDASAGKVGIAGVTAPTYELEVGGDIGTNQYLYHNGDGDTYIKFDTNTVNLVAGGKSAIKYDSSTGKIVLNNTNADVDLNVNGDDGSIILQTDATNNRVGINTVPTEALHVDGNVTVNDDIHVSGNTKIIGTLSANTVSGDTVVVGPAATSYTLPTTRGTNRYVLQTNAAGGTAWVSTADTNTSYFVERFQVFDTARTDGNYKYPKPMTSTGRMAQVDVDYGSATISEDRKIARATVLKSAYFVVPSTCTLEKIVGWGEFASSNTIRVDICKFTLTDDETSTLGPTSIGNVSYEGGSDVQKTRSFASTGIGASLSQGDVIMPMVKAEGLASGSFELSTFFTLEFKYTSP